ncbi:MAG: hypothetical protein GXP42_17900 [Chloroflexi bacterium]|nr:hypothetical protein [Chloroflexota bacterium]
MSAAGPWLRDRRLNDNAPAFVAAAALLFWSALRWQAEWPAMQWAWRAALGWNAAWRIQMDGWAWLTGFGILLILLAALVLPGWRVRPGFIDARLWALLAAAAALLVVLSGSWMTLLAAWAALAFLMGALAGAESGGSARAWIAGLFSLLLLFLAPLLNGLQTFWQPLEALALNAQAQLLATLAGALLFAVYPFHLWVAPRANRSAARQLALHFLPGLAAFYLLARFPMPLLLSQAWIALTVVALLGSALAAWATRDVCLARAYMFINRASWAALAMGLAFLPAPAGAVAPLAALMAAIALWLLADAVQQRMNWQWPRYLALAALYGLPFTPAFAPNLLLGRLLLADLSLVAWLLVLLAQTLFVAALWLHRPTHKHINTPAHHPSSASALLIPTMIMVAGLALWWGAAPGSLAALTGADLNESGGQTLALVSNVGLTGWFTLFAPLVLGWLLARGDEPLFAALREWQETVAHAAGLDWLYHFFGRLLHGLIAAWGYAVDIVDGAGQFGWALLAFLIAMLILTGG